jgi:hypothetical protein
MRQDLKIRPVFYVFLAFVGVLIFGGLPMFVQSRPTSEQQLLLFGSLVCVVLVFFAAFGLGMLVYGFKTRSIVAAGKYGGKEYFRDDQPFGYWAVMLMYFCFFAFSSCSLYLFAMGLYVRGNLLKP